MLIGVVPAEAAPVTPLMEPLPTTGAAQIQPATAESQQTKPVFQAPATSPFADVAKSQQFYNEMAWLAAARVSTGWAEANGTKTYRALQPVNRDAMAAFMYRLSGEPSYTPPAVSPFSDIATSQQFYKEMAWLSSTGISTGWQEANGTKTYRATQPVNRDAMAAFLYRLAGKPDYAPPAKSPFTDVVNSQQFYKEMAWLSAIGISTGWQEGNGTKTYRALQAVNRDAMAAFMYRFHQYKSPLKISSDRLVDGIAGLRYLDQLAGTGGFGPLVWSASGLPRGVTISPGGALAGSPASTGLSTVTVTATDSAGMSVSRTLNLDIPEATPQECAGKPCEIVVPNENTIHVPGDSIVAINRDPGSNEIVSVELTATKVSAGQILTLPPWANAESGAVLLVDAVDVTAQGTTLLTVSAAKISSAYSEGTVHFTDAGSAVPEAHGPTAEPTRPADPQGAKGPLNGPKMDCDRGATADLRGLSVTPNLKPDLYADWNVLGLRLLRTSIDGSITVNMGAAVSGEGTCTMTGPEVKVTVPSGTGAIVMVAQPSLTFEVSGKLDISTSVTMKCGTSYLLRDGQESRAASCTTEHEPLGLTSDSGIDAKLTGAVDTRVTWMDIAGVTGNIEASMEAGFHPTGDPMTELKASVGYELGACALCFWDESPAHLTIYSGTVFEKTIATWSTKPEPPGKPDPEEVPKTDPLKVLSASLATGTAGKPYKAGLAAVGGTPAYTWKVTKGTLPQGLVLSGGTGIVSGVPTAAGTNPVTITVTDSLGTAASVPLTLVVKAKPPRGKKVLVYGYQDDGYGVTNLAQTLRAAGVEVDESETLPDDLDAYKSIWNPSYNSWTSAEEQRVAGFVADGGAAYLTGERPCCESLNGSVQRVLRQVLTDQNVVVGKQGDIDGPFTFNPAASNKISKVPNVLSDFEPDAPGAISGMAGVDARNVFARSDSIVVGGVWAESDMKTKRGRVVVLMDINYLEFDPRAPIIQNVQHFLSGTP
jgi:hypothetical protein